MSLIDQSYFVGYLTIPQLGQPAVSAALNIFIQQQEPIILQAALGYELWEDFVDGLSQPSIDQKWLNLRDGVTFDQTGYWPPFYWTQQSRQNPLSTWFIPRTPNRRARWIGFCGGQPVGGTPQPTDTILIVGSAGGPIANTTVFTTSTLANTVYGIERRGFGTMLLGTDVDISNNGQTITLLKPGDKFTLGEVFIIHFSRVNSTASPSAAYPSPLAGYTYYAWLRDQAANMSAMGVVNAEAENATDASGMLKLNDAFNRASKDIINLWSFLDVTWRNDPTIYPSYNRMKIDYQFFKPVNKYGI